MPIIFSDEIGNEFVIVGNVPFVDRLSADYNDIGERKEAYEYGPDDFDGDATFCDTFYYSEEEWNEEARTSPYYVENDADYERDMYYMKRCFDGSARRKSNGSWVYGFHKPVGTGLPSSAKVEVGEEEEPQTPSFGSVARIGSRRLQQALNPCMARYELRNKPDQSRSWLERLRDRRRKRCKKNEQVDVSAAVSFKAILDSFLEFSGQTLDA